MSARRKKDNEILADDCRSIIGLSYSCLVFLYSYNDKSVLQDILAILAGEWQEAL
jgi:hypothetical protein